MSSPSYWLSQIKQSEAVGKHQVSLGFFKLALEAGCKNVEVLRDELKSYCFRHKLVDVGESSFSKRLKKLFQIYNIPPRVPPKTNETEHLSFVMQVEIMKRLPIKSLIRFRSVSKQWKSLISSSEFVVDYSLNHTQSQKHLLVRYLDPEDDYSPKYVSIVDDDDTFPDLQCFLTVPMPVSRRPIVTSSQGLFCFRQPYESQSNRVVLWNPTIRKSVSVDVPNMLDGPFDTVVGFGVCPSTSDPMLVKIRYGHRLFWQVEIFSLSSGLWRTPLCYNLPCRAISIYHDEYQQAEIAIDGCIYWLASDILNSYDLIMSFDMTRETFTEVYLPESLAHNQPKYYWLLSKLRESLCVIEQKEEERFELWIMMDNGVLKSFTKLYNIDIDRAGRPETVLGFRNNGEPIVIMYDNAIYTYEPNEEDYSDIGIYGDEKPPLACSYMETLLLLDH